VKVDSQRERPWKRRGYILSSKELEKARKKREERFKKHEEEARKALEKLRKRREEASS
jgi:hypothetical protein